LIKFSSAPSSLSLIQYFSISSIAFPRGTSEFEILRKFASIDYFFPFFDIDDNWCLPGERAE
jgi:hypothetical protein